MASNFTHQTESETPPSSSHPHHAFQADQSSDISHHTPEDSPPQETMFLFQGSPPTIIIPPSDHQDSSSFTSSSSLTPESHQTGTQSIPLENSSHPPVPLQHISDPILLPQHIVQEEQPIVETLSIDHPSISQPKKKLNRFNKKSKPKTLAQDHYSTSKRNLQDLYDPTSPLSPSAQSTIPSNKPKKVKQGRRQPNQRTLIHRDSSIESLPTYEELCNPDGRLPEDLVLELQTASCVTLPVHLRKYRCSPCIGKQVGFICAFRFIRKWVCKKDPAGVLVGGPTFPAFTEHSSQLDYRSPQFPTGFNRLPSLPDLIQLRRLLARILLPAIESEIDWLRDEKVKFIGRRIDLVTKCDYCSATLIGAAWWCTHCGAEACLRCFELMNIQAQPSIDSPQTDIHVDWLKRLKTCTKWHDSKHDPSTHIKISHITLQELEGLQDQMRNLLNESSPELHLITSPSISTGSNPYSVPLDLERFLYQPEGDHSEPYIKIGVSELEADPNIFDRLWSTGHMILVTGMKERLKIDWTPSYFTWKYVEDKCQMIDSNSILQCPIETTVKSFFEEFDRDPAEIRAVWKLRDWPPEADFQNRFPELFHDFQQAIPIPDITTRFGIRNVAAHFPTNANVPDIGPKMYIAMKNSDQVGSRGSTVLHMDVADAINIQTYAKSEGDEGCALWHLYHAQDSQTLRKFLYEYQAEELQISVEDVKAKFDDPIHTTRTYINAEMRKTLREKYGVKGWEVKQQPGEAVFIPAYTAHQVCNLANCIKVAADFVSPHSIERCIRLTEEFRLQNHEHRKPWREDLLQINQMLLYAFESTGRQVEEFGVKDFFQ